MPLAYNFLMLLRIDVRDTSDDEGCVCVLGLQFVHSLIIDVLSVYSVVWILSVCLQSTSLCKFIGAIEVVPFFGGSFTFICPWFIVVIAVCTVFDMWGVLARMLNIQRSLDVARSQPGNERLHDIQDAVAKGKELIELSIRNERRMRQPMAIHGH